jgi:hypothetical protein
MCLNLKGHLKLIQLLASKRKNLRYKLKEMFLNKRKLSLNQINQVEQENLKEPLLGQKLIRLKKQIPRMPLLRQQLV